MVLLMFARATCVRISVPICSHSTAMSILHVGVCVAAPQATINFIVTMEIAQQREVFQDLLDAFLNREAQEALATFIELAGTEPRWRETMFRKMPRPERWRSPTLRWKRWQASPFNFTLAKNPVENVCGWVTSGHTGSQATVKIVDNRGLDLGINVFMQNWKPMAERSS
eukprot:Gb_15397 [translate_table: standard]